MPTPLWELLHAVRDNTNLDLRENLPRFFKDFPIEHLLSHYPATYEAAENEYRIGVTKKAGEPDLQAAALSRAAELAMVAFDVNAAESQVLQGWLMHDHFMLRGTFGAPYEFLWANPYQPGLSYYHVPLIYHNRRFRQALRPLQLGRRRRVVRLLRRRAADVRRGQHDAAQRAAQFAADLAQRGVALLRATHASVSRWTKRRPSSSWDCSRTAPIRWRSTTKRCTKRRPTREGFCCSICPRGRRPASASCKALHHCRRDLFRAALAAEIGRAHVAVGKHRRHRCFNLRRRFRHAQMLQHHRRAQDRRQRIDDALARDIRRRAVNRLEHRRVAAQRDRDSRWPRAPCCPR